jgi:hypothetical protein
MPTVEQRLTSLENMLKNNTFGSMLKWRAANLNVPQWSDVSPDVGHVTAGDWTLGKDVERRIVISDIDHGIIDYDELNRIYKRETYSTVYFRLGLPEHWGIDYNGVTQEVEIDGRCNLDDTIPFKALDFSTVLSGFVYDKGTGRVVSLGMKSVDGYTSSSYGTDTLTMSWSDDESTADMLMSISEGGLNLQGTGGVTIAPIAAEGEADSTLVARYDRVTIEGGWLQFAAGPRSGLYPQRPASAENLSLYANPNTGELEFKSGGVWYTLNKTAVT